MSGSQSLSDDPSPIATAIGRLALFIVLVVVIARCTMLETIRDPFEVAPGGIAIPRGPGATSAIVLGLLSALPALLVLLRRLIDPTFRLRNAWANVGLMLLAVWAVCSTFWASDKFLAIVSAINWLGAMTLGWATVQLVRTPRRVAIVSAVGVGLLAVFLTHAAIYEFSELPALRENVAKEKDRILAERGMPPDSFEAQQFLRKINAGEMVGFNASPNTFGALLLLTMTLTAGLAIQRSRDNWPKSAVWLGLFALPLGGLFVMYGTGSRAAFATTFLAALAFAAVAVARPLLRRFTRVLLALFVMGGLAVTAAAIRHAAATGDLYHDSLTFRWRYWLGGWRVFGEHLWRGVGWENFGLFYLAKRLPIASEEVRDPHNFIVRVFVELGIVGGAILLIAIARLLWEITSPASERDELPAAGAVENTAPLWRVFVLPGLVGIAAIALNALCSIDWTQEGGYVELEMTKRVLFGLVLIVGLAVGFTTRRPGDSRPVPWVAAALVIATLGMLVQNLVDFSMFEPSGMSLFALILGAAIGGKDLAKPAEQSSTKWPSIVGLAGGMIAVIVVIATLLAPIATAESQAQAGDDFMLKERPDLAADQYAGAAEGVTYNSDYAYRTARALWMSRANPADVRRWTDRATVANPESVRGWLWMARWEVTFPQPDVSRVVAGYTKSVALDPQGVDVRLEFADVLARQGMNANAVEQYRAALAANAGLHPLEPKRMPSTKVAEIEAKIATLAK